MANSCKVKIEFSIANACFWNHYGDGSKPCIDLRMVGDRVKIIGQRISEFEEMNKNRKLEYPIIEINGNKCGKWSIWS